MARKEQLQPPQHQERQPGLETEMVPRPQYQPQPVGSRLEGKAAVITGGDSGIGRAVAVAFAREGADVSIVYLDEHEDARETGEAVEAEGRRCVLISGDVQSDPFCRDAVGRTVEKLGRLDVLINNAAVQYPVEDFSELSNEQLERTFRTNIFSYFYMTRAALAHLPEGGVIINSTSVTAYRGSPHLVDYAATKGAIVSFTRSLSKHLVGRGIRVNAVAPGPVWTPLIPSSFDADRVAGFGGYVPMERPGQPEEIAPSYVFLASDESSYFTGQVLHPNGGEVVGA